MRNFAVVSLLLVLTASLLPAEEKKKEPWVTPVSNQLYDHLYGLVQTKYYDRAKVGSPEFASLKRGSKDDLQSVEQAIERLRGMLKSLDDPYSLLVVGDQVNKDQEAIQSLQVGRLGVGIAQQGGNSQAAQVDEKGNIKIVAIAPGGAAEKAGLKQGDAIVSIDKADVRNGSFNEVGSKLRGVIGSEAVLKIARAGREFDVKIKREGVRLESVFAMLDRTNNIGIIRIAGFQNSGADPQLAEVMKRMPDVKGFILDLRNNTGGQMLLAISMVSRFLPSGKIVTLRKQVGDQVEDTIWSLTDDALQETIVNSGIVAGEFKTKRQPNLSKDKPVVVLVNENSMSAAELFAAALKDNGRAKLVGRKTFGKGIAQLYTRIAFKNQFLPDIELHLTTSKFLSPKGDWIGDGKGNNAKAGIPVDKDVLGAADRDTQMIAAIEQLGGKFESLEQFELLSVDP